MSATHLDTPNGIHHQTYLKILSLFLVATMLSGCSYFKEVEQAIWPDDTTAESDELMAEPETSSAQLEAEVSAPPLDAAPMPAAAMAPPQAAYAPSQYALAFPPATVVSDTGTFTAGVTANIRTDLDNLQGALLSHSDQASQADAQLKSLGEIFYGLVAAMEARLQAGTTSANPILVEQWSEARYQLDQAKVALSNLSQVRTAAANDGGVGGFLLDNIRQAMTLPGSVELDMEQLQALEVEVGSTILVSDSLNQRLSEAVRRQSAFVSAAERQLKLLSGAIKNGVPYGPSLSAVLPPASGAKKTSQTLLIITPSEEDSVYATAGKVYEAVAASIDSSATKGFEVVVVTGEGTSPAEALVLHNRAQATADEITNFGISPANVAVKTKSAKVRKGQIHIVANG